MAASPASDEDHPEYFGNNSGNSSGRFIHKQNYTTAATATATVRKRRGEVPLAISVSAGISFLLLTLSVLEAVPSGWMLVFNATFLPTAYRILFTGLVVLVFVVFPFAAGARQGQGQGNLLCLRNRPKGDAEHDKKQGQSQLRSCLFKVLGWIFQCMFEIMYRLAYVPTKRMFFRRPKEPRTGPILTMSASSNDSSDSVSTGTTTTKNAASTMTTVQKMVKFPQINTLVGGLCGIFVVFCMFRILGPCVIRTTEQTPLLTVALSWLTAMGLLLSAAINGFGSVFLPHSCLAGFYLEPIHPEAISKAQEEVRKANDSLQDRKEQLGASAGLSLQSGSAASSSSSSNKRMSFSDIGEEVSLRRKTLQSEIEFLEALLTEMKEEVTEMKEMRNMAAGARTPMGRFKLWLGVVFSFVLLVRLFAALVFLWKHDYGGIATDEERKSGSDPITMILLWLLGHHYVTQQEYNALSQLISVILTAILSFSQVRTFWRVVDMINRRLENLYRQIPCTSSCQSKISSSSSSLEQNQNQLGSAGVYENVLACLMASYFLSCIVLTKFMLPPDYRVAFADALGDNGTDTLFRIRSYAVNLTFTMSSLLTVFVLGIGLGIQRQNTVRHLSVWKSTTLSSEYTASSSLEP